MKKQTYSTAIALTLLLLPAFAFGHAAEYPEHVGSNIESDDTPECITVRDSSASENNMKALYLTNRCTETFRIRPKSCEVTKCDADSGCSDVRCDGDWFRVPADPDSSAGAGTVPPDGGTDSPDASFNDDTLEDDAGSSGDTYEPDAGSNGDTYESDADSNGDASEFDAADAGSDEGSDDSDTGTTDDAFAGDNSDVNGPVDYDLDYTFADIGFDPAQVGEKTARIDTVFEWELGDSRSGTIEARVTYIEESPNHGGCLCSSTRNGSAPLPPLGAPLLLAAGLLALRTRD